MASRSYHARVTQKTKSASRAHAPIDRFDPLLDLIRHYERQRAMLDASDETNPLDAQLERNFNTLYNRLSDETPECSTDEGAIAALALVGYEMQCNAQSDLADALIRAVAVYARRRSLAA